MGSYLSLHANRDLITEKQLARHVSHIGNSVAGFPAYVKLVAGCTRQLQRIVRKQAPDGVPERCSCKLCQPVQAFLDDPMQTELQFPMYLSTARHIVK